MCPNTQHQHKAAEQGGEAGQERGEKETELALLQSYILRTILACFPLEGLWKNWKYWKEKMAENI